MGIGPNLKLQIKEMPPVYFALVMASGIVSIACHLLAFKWLSICFFYLNNLNYGVLLLMLIARILLYPRAVMADLSDSSTGPGFLTFVAGSGMLGVQYCLIRGIYSPAIVLWVIGFVGWIFFLYAFLFIRITQAAKPSLESGLNGGWLLMVVSTQSLSILGSQLSAHLSVPATVTLFFTMAAYLLGLFIYIMLIAIIFFRMIFDPMKPQEFVPPYWVLMGAAAITTLSGAVLIQSINKSGVYTDWIASLKALSLLSWIVASWWIPLLFMLEIWRHFYKKVPFKYEPANWDTVFTLGMYTVCTFQFTKALQIPFLIILPQVFVYAALLAWLITFFSMLRSWGLGGHHDI
jgi:tellurite resistance protein TehA-like permease